MIFPEMQPFVNGEFLLKQPIGSSWCVPTCIDVVIAYALTKVYACPLEVSPFFCEFERADEKKFKSSVNILKGGFNEERYKDQAWENPFHIAAIDSVRINGIKDRVARANGIDAKPLNFEEKNIYGKAFPDRIIDFLHGNVWTRL